jgi:hypothetical protein
MSDSKLENFGLGALVGFIALLWFVLEVVLPIAFLVLLIGFIFG